MQMQKVPIGLRMSFNLCNLNDENLVNRITNILEQASSLIMEALEGNSNNAVEKSEKDFEKVKEETMDTFENRKSKKLILEAKKQTHEVIRFIKESHNRKLIFLMIEGDEAFENCLGSRNIVANKYVKAIGCNCTNEGEPVPYVKQLRQHRRNRKHKQIRKDITEYVRTVDDLERLDPVVLTDKVELTELDKEVLRLPDRFAPTPESPVDVFDQALGTHEWAERMRWRYFWNRDKTEEEIENEEPFEKKPWYQSKGTAAPKKH